MTKYVLDNYVGPELDYSTLGFRANVGDILDATGAPDARWSVNADQGAAETVTRYTIGQLDPSYVEPTDGHVLTYSDEQNRYVPTAPTTFVPLKWKPATAYVAGDIRQAPDGTTIRRNTDGTSAATFTLTELATPVLDAPTTATTGGTIAAGTTYFYKATALNALGETIGSTEVSQAIAAALTTPVNAAFTTATTGGTLAAGTYSYRVSATNAAGETLASTATTQTVAAALAAPVLAAPTTATTGGTLAAATYYYKATAINAVGETIGSNEVSIATTGTTSTVGLSWAAITGATGYKIYRATVAGGESTSPALVATLDAVTTYTDTGTAVSAGAVPATNTTATTTNTVTVNWGAVADATGYKVYGRTDAGELLMASVGAVTTWTDTGAVTPAGALPASNTTATNTNTVGLSWAAITDATGYRIYRATTAGGQSTSPAFVASVGAVTTYTDTGTAVTAGAVPATGTTSEKAHWTPVSAVAGTMEQVSLSDTIAAQTVSVYRPETYGAVGDGVTDDSEAWQTMLTSIASDGTSARVECQSSATYLLANANIDSVPDLLVEGNGATIKSRAVLSPATIQIGATVPVGKVVFRGLTFDDNASARAVEDKPMVAYRGWDILRFEDCAFVDCAFHFLSNWGTGTGGQQSIVVQDCTFDGATTSFTGSHVYASGSDVDWIIRGCTFSNAGHPEPDASQQGAYIASCKSFLMSDCTFINCGKTFDVRSGAAGVLISNILVVGGPKGASTSGTAEIMCYQATDAVIQNVSIVNSYKADVVRVVDGARNVLRNITYRSGPGSPVGQYGFRIGGADHRVVDPDFILPEGSGTSAVFRLEDQPTNLEIDGGSVEGGGRLFFIHTSQATVAARATGIRSRGHSVVWAKSAGGGSGNAPTPALRFDTTEWWPYAPTIGNAAGSTVNYARFSVSGTTIRVQASITLGGAAGSIITVSLPYGPRLTSHPAGTALAVGSVVGVDVSASAVHSGTMVVVSSEARMVFGAAYGGASNPFAWAAEDHISLSLEYEHG